MLMVLQIAMFWLGFFAGVWAVTESNRQDRLKQKASRCEYHDGETDVNDRPHSNTPDCWCHPDLVLDGDEEFGDVWVHKAPGEELAPARIIAEAIADAMRSSC
jgi:hypothetical protein